MSLLDSFVAYASIPTLPFNSKQGSGTDEAEAVWYKKAWRRRFGRIQSKRSEGRQSDLFNLGGGKEKSSHSENVKRMRKLTSLSSLSPGGEGIGLLWRRRLASSRERLSSILK